MIIPASPHARRRRACVLVLLLVCAWGLGARAEVALSRVESDSLERKILGIQQYAASSLEGARLTPVSEAELNSYIRFALAGTLPAGVVDPYVTMAGEGEVRGRATVDLDQVRRAKARSWLDPLAYLSGRLPVTAEGRLTAQGGLAQFELTTAAVAGVTVPKVVLQELVSFYSRSDTSPEGVSLDDTFRLPARIDDIAVEPGRAMIIQR
jgi:hypothetical protein